MRLRIQTCPPSLPLLRVWLVPTSASSANPNELSNISELKKSICTEIPALKSLGLKARDISLLLDEFELLDETPFNGALRDGDLVLVRRLAGVEGTDNAISSREAQKENVEGASHHGIKRKRRTSSVSLKANPTTSNKTMKTNAGSKKRVSQKSEPDDEDSDSDSSDSSTDSSVSTSSSGSTSSTSSSSSSSSSTPSERPTRVQSQKAQILSRKRELAVVGKEIRDLKTVLPPTLSSSATAKNALTVPPGLGKPTTHSRNERRRRKRAAERDSKTIADVQLPLPKGSSLANSVPLGLAKGTETSQSQGEDQPREASSFAADGGHSEDEAIEAGGYEGGGGPSTNGESSAYPKVIMASLRNKNKKKGFFRQAMERGLTDVGGQRKIVFADKEQPVASGDLEKREAQAETQTQQSQQQRKKPFPRLVPPSELQGKGLLPKNVFVTSVDVEEGMWDDVGSGNNSKGKRRKKNQKNAEPSTSHLEYDDPDQFMDAEEEVVQLVYDDDDSSNPSRHQEKEAGIGSFDWAKTEREWSNYKPVTEIGQLEVGSLVGWKGLALNPVTFCPEVMLSVARVIQRGGSAAQKEITVRHLVRPDAGQAAIAFGIVDGTTEDDSVEEEGEEVTFPWSEVVTAGDAVWRIVDEA